MIELNDVSRYYGRKAALDHFSLSLRKGKIVGLLGENGSGKTTLFKILMGMDRHYYGEVRIHGKKPGAETKAMISYLPDRSFLNPRLTAEQHFAFYASFFPDFDLQKARAMLRDFQLEANRKTEGMSLGMQEKLQICLCMARRAKVYLMDEPISGVDPRSRKFIVEGILKSYTEDALLFISTHLVHEIENILDEAVFISQGRVVLHREAEALRAEHGLSIEEYMTEVLQ